MRLDPSVTFTPSTSREMVQIFLFASFRPFCGFQGCVGNLHLWVTVLMRGLRAGGTEGGSGLVLWGGSEDAVTLQPALFSVWLTPLCVSSCLHPTSKFSTILFLFVFSLHHILNIQIHERARFPFSFKHLLSSSRFIFPTPNHEINSGVIFFKLNNRDLFCHLFHF